MGHDPYNSEEKIKRISAFIKDDYIVLELGYHGAIKEDNIILSDRKVKRN